LIDWLINRLTERLSTCYSAPNRHCHHRGAQVHGVHQAAPHIPALPSQPQPVLIYRPRKDGGLSKPRPRVRRATGPWLLCDRLQPAGLEPTTSRLLIVVIERANHRTIMSPMDRWMDGLADQLDWQTEWWQIINSKPTIHESPVEQWVVDKSLQYGHDAVTMITQHFQHTLTRHAIIAVNSCHLTTTVHNSSLPLWRVNAMS